MEGNNLTEGNLFKNMKKLLIPLIFTNILNSIYTIVDGIWVGNLIGDVGVAAITNSYPIITAIISISTGMSIGASVIISQYFGAKKLDRVKTISGLSYILLGLIGILFTTVSIVLLDLLLKIINVPSEILYSTKKYTIIYLIGYLFYFIFEFIVESLRAIGDSKTPLKFVIMMTSANLILDPILIKSGLGVFGAGLSTAISIIFGTLIAVIYVNRKSELLKFSIKKEEIKKEDIIDIFKVAIPVIFQELFVALTYLIEINLINQMGVVGIAAYGVVEKVGTVIYIAATSFQTLMTATVGQFIGNNKINLTKEIIKNGLRLAILPTIVIAISLYIFPRECCRLFVSSNEVIDAAMDYISLIAITLVLLPIRGIITGFIIGTGHTKVVLFSMICAILTEISLLYLLRNSSMSVLTKTGIAVTAFWSIKMLLEVIYYFSGKWKEKIIVKEGV